MANKEECHVLKLIDAIVVGGGPCGMAAAISLKEIGLSPLIIEKGNVVNAIYNYPTHQTFFSTSEKLEIGNVAFVTENHKPKRNQALVYYREVAKRHHLKVNRFEIVEKIIRSEKGIFTVYTSKETYQTPYVIIATGYYDHPNELNVPGDNLNKVYHYFKEGHPYFDTDVLVIGGKNSAIDAALELHKAGARVTVIHRGSDYSPSIKPWILPEFESLARKGEINMVFDAKVKSIEKDTVTISQNGNESKIKNDYVFAMIGYHPNHSFLQEMGIDMDQETGKPFHYPETMETNVPGMFIAGVISAGNNANEIFIENGRFHGGLIAESIKNRI
jgi:thioredoxin reductase (NADPH)